MLFNSCFTGIESTPRISAGDVRKRDAAQTTAEQRFLSDVHPETPASWNKGKRFFVTDDKISIIFSPDDVVPDSLAGSEIIFDCFEDTPSVTGEGSTVICFTTESTRQSLRYKTNIPMAQLSQRQSLEVPFTVEQSVVWRVDSAMRGNTYYIATPKWFDAVNDAAHSGRRHIPVTITSVKPGSHIYPLKVYFTCPDDGNVYWIPMTVGDDRAATRNFHTVFNFDNPRHRYPHITDSTWQLITGSRVTAGMTRDECRLALGAPNSYRTIPVYNAVVEQWSYDDGVYLIFEDGILTRYRI